MNNDLVTPLRRWADRFGASEVEQESANVLREAANEIERLQLTCHYLAGWISYRENDIDPKQVVESAYQKVVRYV